MGIPQKGRASHAAVAVSPRVPTSLAVIVATLPQPIQDRQPLMRALEILGLSHKPLEPILRATAVYQINNRLRVSAEGIPLRLLDSALATQEGHQSRAGTLAPHPS